MLNFLSLGGGVQSSTVLMMSLCGELEPLDHVIFADTGWEPAAVYRHLEWLEAQCAGAGVPFHRVSAGNIRADTIPNNVWRRGRKSEGQRSPSLPFYTQQADGRTGIVQRQCTGDYKIAPIEKRIRELLGIKPRSPWPKTPVVRLWMGISADEQRRARIAPERWKEHYYPLIFGPRPMRRHDCLNWMQAKGYPLPPRSACIGCPFHSDAEWRALTPEEFADACEFDAAIRRKGGVRGDLFLHRSCQPLIQVDLSTPEDRGQLSLGDWREECLGYCGV